MFLVRMCQAGDEQCADSAMRELCGNGDGVGCRELVARELCGNGDGVGCRARLYVVFVNDSLCALMGARSLLFV